VDQQILPEAVIIMASISQHGFGVWNRKHHQGICGFVIRDLTSAKDKAERASLIVTSDMDFARKAAA